MLKTIFNCKICPRVMFLCGALLTVWAVATPRPSWAQGSEGSGTSAAVPAAARDGAAGDAARSTQRVAQVVDYVAADYSGAVRDGQVIEASEYAEQKELLESARKLLPSLVDAAVGDKAAMLATLTAQLTEVVKAVDEKAAASEVLRRCRTVRETLKNGFALRMVPAAAVDAMRGAALYGQLCASCHGATGRADTPAAAALKPPPVSFHDPDRMPKVAPALAFHTLSFGVAGTAMAPFDTLPAQDRWHLAFYVVALRHGQPGQVQPAPTTLPAATLAQLQSSAVLAELSDEELDAELGRVGLAGEAQATARRTLLDYLRASAPYLQPRGGRFAVVHDLLEQSLTAAQGGDFVAAHRLAIAAYLDGIEPHEAALRIEKPQLVPRIEAAFAALRQATDPTGNPTAGAASTAAQNIRALLVAAEPTAEEGAHSMTKSLLASLVIALREGLEVALLIAALLAFLRKSGHVGLARSVHLGWLAAVPAGLLTFALIGHLIDGARRELAEGLITLLAAVVLITVTHWVLGAREAKHWLGFLRSRVQAAADRQSRQSLALFGIAFFAAYREALETVLFYRALLLDAGPGGWKPILLGIALGLVILFAVVLIVGRIGRKLNPRPVMLASSVLLAVLSISLTGHGIHALQEGGYVKMGMIAIGDPPWTGFSSLGIYPTWQGLLAQLGVTVLLLLPTILERLRTDHTAPPPPADTQPSRA